MKKKVQDTLSVYGIAACLHQGMSSLRPGVAFVKDRSCEQIQINKQVQSEQQHEKHIQNWTIFTVKIEDLNGQRGTNCTKLHII